MKAELLKKDQVLSADSGTYTIVKRIGLTGATARVYQVRRQKDDTLFALKLMQPGLTPQMQEHFRGEMVNLQRLRTAEEQSGTSFIPRIIESSDLQRPKTQELFIYWATPLLL